MSSLRSIPVQNQVPVTQLYRKLEIVGKGAYGAVYRGVHIPTGDIVALKIINLDTPDDDVEDIQREVALLSQLRGPGTNNITKYYGCYLDGPHVWIVMDYASGGSVRTLMKATKGNVIDERHSVVITRELLSALVYIHKSGVIHRDIKAANVLVTDQGRVLLCDFGVSALLSTAHAKRTTFVGTPYWMAPEVITSGSMYDSKADIWSLGITLYEMTTGAPPHSNQVEVKVLSLIPSTKPPRLAEHEGSKDMRDFVAMCLKEVPGERAGAEELTKAKWIKSAAKTPVSILKELVVQYEAWGRAGGVRKSLFEADEEEEDSLKSNNRESTWEFDTLRGGSFVDFKASGEGSTENETALGDPPTATAIPPPQRVPPRSLRMLFEGTDNPSGGSDPFGLRSRMTPPAPALPLSTSTSMAPVLSSAQSSADADRTVKQSASSMAITPPSAKSPVPPPLVPPLPPLQTAFVYIETSSTSPQASGISSASTSNSHSTRSSSRSRSSSSPTSSSRGSDPATARQATFAFPPLPPVSATTVTVTSTSLASSSSSSLSSSSQTGLHPLNTTLLSSSSDDDSIGIRPPRSARTPTYREVRQNRGLPDISIPPNLNKSKTSSASPTSSSPPTRSIPPSFPAVSSSSVRNDSIASGSSTSTIRRVRKVATASPVNFQFPASTRPRVESQPEHPTSSPTSSPSRQLPLTFSMDELENDVGSGKTSPPTLFRTTSPTSSTIVTSSSPTSHLATHSFDDSVISSPGTIRHRTGLAMPLPPFSRAHSATPAGGRRYTTATNPETGGAALSRGPSLNRQGSVAVMETVPMPTTSMADRAAATGVGTGLITASSSSLQLPLSLLRGRNRSESASAAGYRSEGDVGGGGGGLKMPALRDVLKVCFSNLVSGPDFLPPSPSVHAPLNRPQTRPHQPPIPLQIVTAAASSSTTSLDQQLSSSSSLLEGTSAASDTVKAPAPTAPLQPPAIKPLELLKSTLSPAEAQAELARTVDDLAKWLSVVETGLTNLLEKSLFEGHSVVIQENREEEDAVDGGVFANSGGASDAGDSGVISLDIAH